MLSQIYAKLKRNKKLFNLRLIFLLLLLLLLPIFVYYSQKKSNFIPKAVEPAISDTQLSKTGMLAVPYVMNDYENCNPKTLKKGDDISKDCWQSPFWNISLPLSRADYLYGSFGSHMTFSWKQLQTGPNQFNWNSLDNAMSKANAMQIKDSEGNIINFKPLIIAFDDLLEVSSDPHDGIKDFIDYTPGFIMDQIPISERQNSISGCDTQDQTPYHNNIWQREYKLFIEAVAEHISTSPNSVVVQAILMSGGLSNETTPSKNLSSCKYKDNYLRVNGYENEYNQFILDSMDWYHDAFFDNSLGKTFIPIYIQSAAASAYPRNIFEEKARSLQIGIKQNSLAPSNENSYNARYKTSSGGRGGLYDYIDILNIQNPSAFEPVSYYYSANPVRCSSTYCNPEEAQYQYLYWNILTALSHYSDFFDFQKIFFKWKYEMSQSSYRIDWLDAFVQQSLGKSPNQSKIAWIAFADKLIDLDSYPNPRPQAPVEKPLNGNYGGDNFPAEFTERGDKNFYLYRLGEYEDSSLIRNQGGNLGDNQENYSLKQNSCFKTSSELPNNKSKILSGQELRNHEFIKPNLYSHPFSITAIQTIKNQEGYYISLALDDYLSRIKQSDVSISVYYLDFGNDKFAIEYYHPTNGITQEIVNKTNSKTWKEYTFIVNKNNISWSHSFPGGADLRLNCLCDDGGDDDIFHMLKATSLSSATNTPPAYNLSFCQSSLYQKTPTPTINISPTITPTENIYYISPNGNDNNSGAINAPWRTFVHAAASVASGDTVYIRKGTYQEELRIKKSGSPGNYITFAAYPGEKPVIDGANVQIDNPNNSALIGLVHVQNQSYVRIAGLTVRNSSLMGISAHCNPSATPRKNNIIFENNVTEYTNSSGIAIWGCDNATVKGNHVKHGAQKNPPVNSSQENISVTYADGFEISNNIVELSEGVEGIDAKEGVRNGSIHHNIVRDIPYVGIYVDAAHSESFNIDIYENEVNNTGGILISPEEGGFIHDIRVFKNRVSNSGRIGVGWGGADIPNKRLSNIDVYQNTVWNSNVGLAIHGVSYTADATQSFDNIRFFNNIVYNNSTSGMTIAGDLRNGAQPSQIRMSNILIANNTFYNNGVNGTSSARHGIRILENSFTAQPLTIKIKNNIIYDTSTNLTWPTRLFVVDTNGVRGKSAVPVYSDISHNLVFPIGNQDYIGDQFITQAPEFVSVNELNFALSSSSPAIDNGSQEEMIFFDFDGIPRPQGAIYDMGAFEYTNGIVATVTPTPTNTSIPQTTDTPSPTPQDSFCPMFTKGDSTCDGIINLTDYLCWRYAYIEGSVAGSCASHDTNNDGVVTVLESTDFNEDGKLEILDFVIWQINFIKNSEL